MAAAEHVVVVTGAAPLDPAAVAEVTADAYMIAADGGLDHALAAGLRPHRLVGDLDSVSAAGRAWASVHASVDEYPPDKDDTDTELALAAAVARRPARVTLLAGAGDRLDHTIAAIGALGATSTAIPAVTHLDGWWGDQQLFVAGPGRSITFSRPAGTTFSVIALHGPCDGVSVTGARWPLDHAALAPAGGLGVSNRVSAGPVSIACAVGVLTVIVQPSTSNRQEHP